MLAMIERRRDHRVLALKPARIVFNYRSVIDCRIRNLSAGGACLELPSGVAVPGNFDLIMDRGDDTRVCRVVWRSKDQMGVSFQ